MIVFTNITRSDHIVQPDLSTVRGKGKFWLLIDIRIVDHLKQVRLTHQFEEGLTIGVHLVSAPKKAKLTPGGYR